MTRYTPTAAEIDAVQRETGMDHIQARNNLVQREALREMAAAELRARCDAARAAWRATDGNRRGGAA